MREGRGADGKWQMANGKWQLVRLGLLAWMVWGWQTGWAHTLDETVLTLSVSATNVAGCWDVARHDLEQGLRMSAERWRTLAPAEQEGYLEALVVDSLSGLEVRADGRALVWRVTDLEVVTLHDALYQRVRFVGATAGPAVAALEVNARALLGAEANRHGLLRVEHSGRTEATPFQAGQAAWTFRLTQPAARAAHFWTFVEEGMAHIWKGPDHILFLLALLLPAVFRREGGAWGGADALRPTLVRVLEIVTAFTVAHSITLSLAVLGIARVPARIVEPLIAASVILAALNNLRPWLGERGWLVAFVFGLVHGFGLAGGLLEFGVRGESLWVALAGFNGGVELGQAAVVGLFLPVVFPLAGTSFYRKVALQYGSAAVAVVAGVWMAERLLAFKVLPF